MPVVTRRDQEAVERVYERLVAARKALELFRSANASALPAGVLADIDRAIFDCGNLIEDLALFAGPTFTHGFTVLADASLQEWATEDEAWADL